MPTLYEILEISPTASPEEVKRSYRQLSKKYHPDLNPGKKVFEDKTKEINKAYDILSDPELRANYDWLLLQYAQAQQQATQQAQQQTYNYDDGDYEYDPKSGRRSSYYPLDGNLPYSNKQVLWGIFIFLTVFVGGFMFFGPTSNDKNEKFNSYKEVQVVRVKGVHPISGDTLYDTQKLTSNLPQEKLQQILSQEIDINYYTPIKQMSDAQLALWLTQQLDESVFKKQSANARYKNYKYGFSSDTLLISYILNDTIEDNIGIPLRFFTDIVAEEDEWVLRLSKNSTYIYNPKKQAKEMTSQYRFTIISFGKPAFAQKLEEALMEVGNRAKIDGFKSTTTSSVW